MIPIFRPHATPSRNRTAFTLFEVVLAIGLAVVLVGLLATAVHLYLVAIDAGRNEVEQTQLARAILQRMSDDIRAAFQFSEQDVSSVATLAEETGSFDLESLDEEDPDTTTDSEDDTAIADNLIPPPVPGVYGNLNELQVDISRIPRFDEIDAMIALAGQAGTEHLSDIRTVSYFMSTNAPIGASTAAAVGISANNMSYGGLYRREMDRATAEFSATSAGGLSTDTAVLLAPEVTWVEFRYFDGTSQWEQWNSDESGGIPLAIEVRIWLRPPDEDPDRPDYESSAANTGPGPNDAMYWMTVRLPNAKPTFVDTSSALTDDTGSSSGTSGSEGASL